MAVLQTEMLTLADYHKRKDPKGGITQLIELTTKESAIFKDAPFYPSNKEDCEQVTARTSLPSADAWGRINKGTKPTKTDVDRWQEPIGFKEFLIALDARNNPAPGALMQMRAQELAGHAEAMAQGWERAFLYHNVDENPDGIMGLIPRLDDISNPQIKQRVISATPGAKGTDFTSALLVCWGPKKTYGVFPPGFAKTAGLEHEDMGKVMWEDGEGGKFPAWVSILRQWAGLVVADIRSVARGQFKVSTLDAKDTTVRDTLIRMIHRVKLSGMGRPVIYVHPYLAEILDLQAAHGMTHLTVKSYMGEELVHVRGIPIRVTEALSTSETSVEGAA